MFADQFLQLVRDTQEHLRACPDPAVFADSEDCAYFRKQYKKSAPANVLPPISPVPIATQVEKPIQPAKVLPQGLPEPIPTPITAQIEKAAHSPEVLPQGLPEPIPTPITAQIEKAAPSSEVLPRVIAAPSLAPAEKPAPSPKLPPPAPIAAIAPKPKSELPAPAERENLSAQPVSFGRWKGLMDKIAPEIHFLREIPSDAMAKKIASHWKTKNLTAPITLLSYQEPPDQKALLEQIAIALDVHFGSAKLVGAETIEKEKQWEAFLSVPVLEIVIACDYTLWQLPGLLAFYKEAPALKMRQLGTKFLFLLPDLSLYLKDPLLKRSLWKALCTLPLSPSTKT